MTDTERASAVLPGSPWRPILPFPIATMGGAERAALAYQYAGFNDVPTVAGGGYPIYVTNWPAITSPATVPLSERVFYPPGRPPVTYPVTVPLPTTNTVVRVPPPDNDNPTGNTGVN